MSRFSKYFLQNILCLDDGLCRYLVQDRLWCPHEILDVPVVVFDQERDAEQMLLACMAHNAFFVIDQLRSFLAEACYGYPFVYRMEDHIAPPKGLGDGTVPDSSGRALTAKPAGYTKGPDGTVEINDGDEKAKARVHDQIYNTGTAQRITLKAIENLCKFKIKQETGI